MNKSFVDYAPRVAFFVAFFALVLVIIGATHERRLFKDRFVVSEEGVATMPFELGTRSFGALRIEGSVQIDPNTWAAVKLALVDAQGETIAEAVKEAWSETGDWHEDNESGTWAESDTALGWDVRPDKPEQVTLQLELLGMGTTNSLQEVEGESVVAYVTVSDGALDMRWLSMGLVGAALLFVLVWYAAGHGGRPVIVERSDGEISARAHCNGGLVVVTVSGLVDETGALTRMRLKVRNEQGTELVSIDEEPKLTAVRDDGDLEGFRFGRSLHLVLPPGSYGFYVQVTPDPPIEWIKLLVRDGATTRGPVYIHHYEVPRSEEATS